jgi:hypothetical protein
MNAGLPEPHLATRNLTIVDGSLQPTSARQPSNLNDCSPALVKLSRLKRHAAKLPLARSNMNYREPACRRHLFRTHS